MSFSATASCLPKFPGRSVVLPVAVILLGIVSASYASVTLFVTNNQGTNVNGGTGTIERFTAPGTGTVYSSSSSLSFPEGIAIDVSGNLFVGEADGSITKILTNGFGLSWSQTSAPGPFGEVYDSQGNLYVASAGNNAIYKYDTNGVRSTYLSGGLLNGPTGLALSSLGRFFVSNNTDNRIIDITSTLNPFVFATTGLNGPAGLALDSTGANLYVANISSNNIMKFTTSTTNSGSVFASTGLSQPRGIAFDGSGNLYAANFGNNTIEEFSPTGVASQYASTGLNHPAFIAIVDTVPEPSAVVSLVLGLGILGLSRHRRTASAR